MRPAMLAFYLALLAGGVAMADGTGDTEAHNKAIVQRSFDAWIDGSGSPFDLLTDDASWTIAGRSMVSRTYENRAAFMNEVIRPFNARMSEGLTPRVRSIAADGDQVIILFDGSAVARDGEPYLNTYAWFFDMRNGKVVNATAFFDSIVFDELWQRVQPQR